MTLADFFFFFEKIHNMNWEKFEMLCELAWGFLPREWEALPDSQEAVRGSAFCRFTPKCVPLLHGLGFVKFIRGDSKVVCSREENLHRINHSTGSEGHCGVWSSTWDSVKYWAKWNVSLYVSSWNNAKWSSFTAPPFSVPYQSLRVFTFTS